MRAYELESCFQYISGKFHESNASWKKALGLRDLPMNTPIFDNLLPETESDKDISLFREYDRPALLYMRSAYGHRDVFTLRATAIALSYVKVRQNFLEIYEPFSKILHSLNCNDFLQIHPHIVNIFRKYIYFFSEETASLEDFFKFLNEYTTIFRAKLQQPIALSIKIFYATTSEEFVDDIIELTPFLIYKYRRSIEMSYEKVKKFRKMHLKKLTSRSLLRICLEKKKFSIFRIFLSCKDDVNKTDDNNETILHYLLDSEISCKRELIKSVVDAGFDFNRVTSSKYCLRCRMKKEGFSYYPKECNTLRCLAANVFCQNRVLKGSNISSNLRTIIEIHMQIL